MIRWYLNKSPVRAGKSHLFSLFEERITRDGPVVCSYDGDIRIRADLNDWIQRQIFMYGTYRVEEKHRHFMMSRVRPGSTVLDVGAHIGYYTLLFAKRVGARGRVMAFEPSTRTFRRLQENIELNGFDNVSAVNAAASSQAGVATINLASGENTGSTSLHAGAGNWQSEETRTVGLDDFLAGQAIGNVDLIKIDVEGHELSVLRGLHDTLRKPAEEAPEIFIEVNEATLQSSGTSVQAIFDELNDAGYGAYKITRKHGIETRAGPFSDSLVYFKKGIS
jgi:FkbM family methyltransferase